MITEFSKYRQEPEIEYWDNGQKEFEIYYLNGKIHREDGPAFQRWHENGQKLFENYYLNGKLHREDGPAEQSWGSNGQKKFEAYYLNGNLHREDGPAYQWWYDNGQNEKYFLNDEKYSRKKWIEKLKNIKSPHYEEQKILYDSEKYNL